MQQKSKQTRRPEEGNQLWKVYSELGTTRTNEFRALLACNKIPYTTFSKDTARPLDRIPVGRMQVYKEFFKEVNWEEYMKPVIKTSAMRKEDTMAQAAKSLGLER